MTRTHGFLLSCFPLPLAFNATNSERDTKIDTRLRRNRLLKGFLGEPPTGLGDPPAPMFFPHNQLTEVFFYMLVGEVAVWGYWKAGGQSQGAARTSPFPWPEPRLLPRRIGAAGMLSLSHHSAGRL